jgi:hypothetical protein
MAVYRPTVLSLKQLCTLAVKQNDDVLGGAVSILPKELKKYVDESRCATAYLVLVGSTGARYSQEWLELFGDDRYNIYQGKHVYVCEWCFTFGVASFLFDHTQRNGQADLITSYKFPDFMGPVCVTCSLSAAY